MDNPGAFGQQDGAGSGGAGGGGGGAGGGLPAESFPSNAMVQQIYAQQALAQELTAFWEGAQKDVEEHSEALSEFKNQALPLARIKKIMKSDEDVRMISAEAPVLFARACEFFIQELTLRAWSAAGEHKRRTLQRSDVATAIARTDIFDFLVDIVPREEGNDPPPEATTSGQLPAQAAAAAQQQAQQQAQAQQAQFMPQQPQGGQQPFPGGQVYGIAPGAAGQQAAFGQFTYMPPPFPGLPPFGNDPAGAPLAQFQQPGR